MTETLLTDEERYQLVGVLREMDRAAPPEKRGGLRRKVLIHLWMRRLEKQGPRALQKVMLVDVSQRGLAILTRPEALQKGDKFVVPLEFAEGGGWLVLCEARNCRKLASGHLKVGAQFIDKIEDTKGSRHIPGDWWAYAR